MEQFSGLFLNACRYCPDIWHVSQSPAFFKAMHTDTFLISQRMVKYLLLLLKGYYTFRNTMQGTWYFHAILSECFFTTLCTLFTGISVCPRGYSCTNQHDQYKPHTSESASTISATTTTTAAATTTTTTTAGWYDIIHCTIHGQYPDTAYKHDVWSRGPVVNGNHGNTASNIVCSTCSNYNNTSGHRYPYFLFYFFPNFIRCVHSPGSVFTNHSLEHSLSYSPDFFIFRSI